MHNVWLVLRREYLERVRSKAFILFTLLMPALMAGSILIPAKLGEMRSSETRHIVVAASNSEIAEAVKQQLMSVQVSESAGSKAGQPAPGYAVEISTETSEADRDILRGRVSSGEIDGFLWLTDDALAQHQVVYSAKEVADFGETAELRSAIRAAVMKRNLAQKGMSGPEVEALLTPIELDAVHITRGKEGASGAAVFLTSFVMVMLLYTSVLIYGIAVMRSIIEEKSSRILEVLLASATPQELLAGKILGVGAVGLTQILIWLAVSLILSAPGLLASRSLVSQIHIPPSSIVAFGVFFVLGYFLYSTMYAALGSMVNSDQEAQQLQWPAVMPLIISVFLANPVLQHPNSSLAFWTSMIPFFAPVLMFIRIAIETPPAWQLALCLVLMLGTIYGLLWLSSRIYRIGILMYGKRPTLPELRRWLRYAG